MSTFKKAKAVMLPNNQQTKYLMVYSDVEKTKGKLILNGLKNDEYKEYQHLYIISDDKIKLFDWVYNNKENIVEQINSKTQLIFVLEENKENQTFKKIIATTDKKLSQTSRTEIPQPSQQFIQQFIEEYNKGNIITDVMVEYINYPTPQKDGFSTKYSDNITLTGSWASRLKQCEVLNNTVKINPKDNTITIKKVKDSWKREEVEDLCRKAFLLYKSDNYGYPGLIKSTKEKEDKWIEENL